MAMFVRPTPQMRAHTKRSRAAPNAGMSLVTRQVLTMMHSARYVCGAPVAEQDVICTQPRRHTQYTLSLSHGPLPACTPERRISSRRRPCNAHFTAVRALHSPPLSLPTSDTLYYCPLAPDRSLARHTQSMTRQVVQVRVHNVGHQGYIISPVWCRPDNTALPVTTSVMTHDPSIYICVHVRRSAPSQHRLLIVLRPARWKE